MSEKKTIQTELTEQKSVKSVNALRPQTLKEYIGQAQLKEKLEIYIESAMQRNEPLDHILLYGPQGLGKTTLSLIIANEMNAKLINVAAPSVEKPGELASILAKLESGDILFIDEIHRLPKQVEEVLYSAMEDYRIDVVVGVGPNARTISLDLPKFTLVGATTRAGMLSAPLRDRFGIIEKMSYYTEQELAIIVKETARKLNIGIEKESCLAIGMRSRGTPRIANNIIKRVRDFAIVKNEGIVSKELLEESLNALAIDQNGLNENDRKMLLLLKDLNRPVGIKVIASALGEDIQTIEDVYEPYLIYKGFVLRTPKGRILNKERRWLL